MIVGVTGTVVVARFGFRSTRDATAASIEAGSAKTGEQRMGAAVTVGRTLLSLGGKLHEEPKAKSKAG